MVSLGIRRLSIWQVADIKLTHLGLTFPGFGLVKCPDCKEEKRRKEYKQVQDSDLAKDSAHSTDNKEGQNPTSEMDPIGDSKFDHE